MKNFETLNDLSFIFWKNAEDHGFHLKNNTPATWVSNLHSEVSEFWEAFRNGKLESRCDKSIPLTCAEEELADIIIRTLEVARQLNIDIGKAVMIKHEYNLNRPYLHGNKLA